MATSITNTSITTDNLTVDTNVLKVDSTNNRVGIGTTTPTVDLEILGASSRMKQINSSGHQVNYGLWDGTNYRIEGDANRPMHITSYNTSGDGIKMGISGGNHLQIVNGGYVTMANQPMLALQPDSTGNVTIPNSSVHIVGWKVVGGRQTFIRSGLTLSGNNSNTVANGNNTGRITFSTGGIYYFDCTIRFENTPGTGNIYVYFNGSTIHRVHVEEWSRYNYAHGRVSRCVSASAGDYIEFGLARNGGIFSGSSDTVNWLTIIKVA